MFIVGTYDVRAYGFGVDILGTYDVRAYGKEAVKVHYPYFAYWVMVIWLNI